MNNTISVVIPCFNGKKYILDSLKSAQAEGDIIGEILVVDDASTDDSAAYVEGLRFPKVRLHKLPSNRGIGGARNAALAMASCPYIAFLDADDLWTKGRSKALMSAAHEHHTPWAFGAIEHFISADYAGEANYAVPAVQAGFFASSMLVETGFFRKVGNFDETIRVGEFIDWYDRALRIAPAPALLEQVVLQRRIHGANTSIVAGNLHARDYLKVARMAIMRKRNQG